MINNNSGFLLQWARLVRDGMYRLMMPVDFVFRRLNQLSAYPPIHLRRHVGGMSAGLNGPGYEFVSYLKLLAGLRDGDKLLDMGCGCGLLELALLDQGWRGRLTGTDIHKPCIRWAQRHITSVQEDVRFVHMDVFNEAYWPKGRLSAGEWLDAFDERDFDVVVAKSLFTHVLEDELTLYLKDICDRLNPGGKALLTFFVLSPEQAELAREGRNAIQFQPFSEDGSCKVRLTVAPTAAVAYSHERLLNCFRDAGFRSDAIDWRPGTWTGRADGLSFQDVFILRKP